jgi:hypothetical protein
MQGSCHDSGMPDRDGTAKKAAFRRAFDLQKAG